MQWLRNRNALAVIMIVILAVAIAVIGMTIRPSRTINNEPLPGVEVSDGTVSATDASLYLLVTVGNATYEPILPLNQSS